MGMNFGSFASEKIAQELQILDGFVFNNLMQTIFNNDYSGWNAKLNNSGSPSFLNLFFSTFQADNADTNFGFLYDSTNDLYTLSDLSGVTEYIIIEATSLSAAWDANNSKTIQVSSGKWLVYCTSGTDAVHRAQINKSLWYGTDGSDALIDDFTSVTAVKTSHTNDIDKRALLTQFTPGGGGVIVATGTFNDTSGNNNCSIWTDLTAKITGAQGGITTMNAEFAIGNVINLASQNGGPGTDISFELGTDRSADELTNPADCEFNYGGAGNSTASGIADIVILCEGTVTWSGGTLATEKDYTADDSIPVMVAAGSLSAEGVGNGTLIFKDTASSDVTNAITIVNSTIDASSSKQISTSANGGSNFTNGDNGELVRPITGTALWRKIVITRTDLSKLDIVTEQAVKWS